MTKTQFENKIKEMMKDVIKETLKECTRLFESGAVDTESYENNFSLPKIILAVALEKMSDQYYPLFNGHSEEIRNLKHF